jgi:serine/threonine protein kinase/WD40 repeat protein
MTSLSDPREDAAACDLLAIVQEDRAVGRRRSTAEYLALFPGFETRITRELEELAREDAAPHTTTCGPYALLRELGRGGQAVVWLAEDTRLHRPVALKFLAHGPLFLSSARRERLQREATALARLDHPGICGIHEARLEGEQPFLAMRYVAGETLAERLRRARERPDPQSDELLAALPDSAPRIERVLDFVEAAARALHAAHEAGVVHRDVKPQNVMVDADGRPVLLDFGLARTEDGEDSRLITRSGELFGSVAYMAPEQCLGRHDLDRRCDVYALGVTLYECLTLERPYSGDSTEAILRRVLAGDRRDPARFNAAIPRDLALVVDAALDVDRERRYPTALALAEDLRRLREHRPIAARPLGVSLRLHRWLRRHPVIAVATATLTIALAVTSTLLVQVGQQRRSLLAWQAAIEALSLQDRPIESLARVLAAADDAPERKLNQPLLELLARSPDALVFEPGRLGSKIVERSFFSADDSLLVLATVAGDLVLVDARSGELRRRVRVCDEGVFRVSGSADRRELIATGRDGISRRYRTDTLERLPFPELRIHSDPALSQWTDAVWSEDGRHVALTGSDRVLWFVDLAGELPPRRCEGVDGFIEQIAFEPSGWRCAMRTLDRKRGDGLASGRMHVVDVHSGRCLGEFELFGQSVSWMAWDERGERVLVTGIGPFVRVYDGATRALLLQIEVEGEQYRDVHWGSFCPGGEQIVTAGFEGLTVWDLATRRRTFRVTSATTRPFDRGAWSEDRRQLAVVLKDGTLRVYETQTWTETARVLWEQRYPSDLVWNRAGDRLAYLDSRGLHVACVGHLPHAPRARLHEGAVVSVTYAQDGRSVLSAARDGVAVLWDPQSGVVLARWPHPAPLARARFAQAGDRFVTACADGRARIHAVDPSRNTARSPLVLGDAGAPLHDARFFDGDRRVLTIADDGRVASFDARDGSVLAELPSHSAACLVALVDEERGIVVTGGADRRVLVSDLRSGALRHDFASFDAGSRIDVDVLGQVTDLAIDRARNRLVAGNRSDFFATWRLDDGRPEFIRTHALGQELSMVIAVHPRGRWYAASHSGVSDWTWFDPTSGAVHQVDRAALPNAVVSALAFSPDGALLLVASRDGTACLWDLDRKERHSMVRGAHGAIRSAAFRGDGEWVVTGAQDGTLHAWPVHPLPVARAYYARLVGSRAGG